MRQSTQHDDILETLNAPAGKHGKEWWRRRKAVHEAGHAVVALYLGHEVEMVTIEPEGKYQGAAAHRQVSDEYEDVAICILLAGRQAELSFGMRADCKTDDGDHEDVTQYLRGRIPFIVKRLRQRTRRIIERPEISNCIANVASALLEHETLTGAQVKTLWNVWRSG